MTRKIGAITVGQSPRNDVIPEMSAIMGSGIEILQAGALDGLTREEIERFSPTGDDYVLVSKLRDGGWVKFAEKHILPRLQNCVDSLEAQGASTIVFICTGKFPEIFKAGCPLLYPDKVLHGLVPTIASRGYLGIVTPHADQIAQSRDRWSGVTSKLITASANPYEGVPGVIKAAEELKGADIDLIVLDCIGYTVEMKRAMTEITGKPVILPRTIMGRVISELAEV